VSISIINKNKSIWAVILLVYYAVIAITSHFSSYYSLGITGVFVLVIFVFDRLIGITLIILLFFLSNDQYIFEGKEIVIISSIYLEPYVTMILVVLIGIYTITTIKHNPVKVLFKFTIIQLTLLITSVVIGIEYVIEFPRQAIHDASYFIIPIIMSYFVVLTYNTEKKLRLLMYSIIVVATIKYIHLCINFVIGHGFLAGNLVQVVFDSGKKIVPIFTVYYILLIRNHKKIRFSPKVLLLFKIMVVVTLMLTLSIASRSTMVFLVIMVIAALKIDKKGVLRYTKNITYFVIIMALIIVLVNILQPGSIKFILWKVRSTFEIDIGSGKFSSTSAIVRYVSVLNIFYQHWNDLTLAFGAGAASYFSDSYIPFPFSVYGKTAFPDEWINNNTLFKPHTTPLFLFLKLGLIGTFSYYWSYWNVFFSARRKLNQINDKFLKVSCIVLMVSLIVFTINNYSSKMQIIGGVVVGIIISIITLPGKKPSGQHIAKG
jgi:hypothetical protein